MAVSPGRKLTAKEVKASRIAMREGYINSLVPGLRTASDAHIKELRSMFTGAGDTADFEEALRRAKA
jgi:hypothetical protein